MENYSIMATDGVAYLGDPEKEMSRTARLLELMIRVQTRPRFTAAELAEEFGVSRRTMQRDLAALSGMGVPLRSTPGPGGGYSLPRGGRRLSPSLTVDEALALIASYEALLRYPVHPFSTQGLSAVTKLRAALPKGIVAELDRLRRRVFVAGPARGYEAPLLGELLRAALDGAHLRVTYDSIRSGVSERVIFPYGLYASQGYWYCACFDHRRGGNAPMRADRFLSAERVGGFEVPPELSIQEWMSAAPQEAAGGERMRVRGRKPGAYGGRRMRRKAFLQRVGAQEEVDAREQVHLRPAFATPDDPVSRAVMRDIRRRFPHRSGRTDLTSRSGSLRGGLRWS